MLGGFSLGIIVAAGVYVYSELPPRRPMPAAAGATSDAADRSEQTGPPAAEPPPEDAPTTTPQRAAREETRFEFYDVLPEFEVAVPEPAEAEDRAAREAALARSGSIVVQAGSFRTLAEADRTQARIALLGIESTIQRVQIDDDVYHRVRIGPLTEPAELDRVRRRLGDARIDYLLIEMRD